MERLYFIDMEIVKMIMQKKDVAEETLASAVGLTPRTLRDFLGGGDQRYLTAEIIVKLARALGVSVVCLVHPDYV